MSDSTREIDRWLNAVAQMRMDREKDEEELIKIEGIMENIAKTSSPTSATVGIAQSWRIMMRLIRITDKNTVFLLQTFLTFLSEQAKELDVLRGMVTASASEKKELLNKIEEMEKWREQNEPILRHLDDYLKESGEFLDAHR